MSFARFKRLSIFKEMEDRDLNSPETQEEIKRFKRNTACGINGTHRPAYKGIEKGIDLRDEAVKREKEKVVLKSYMGFSGFEQSNKGYLAKGLGITSTSYVTEFNNRKNRDKIQPFTGGMFDSTTDLIDRVNYARGTEEDINDYRDSNYDNMMHVVENVNPNEEMKRLIDILTTEDINEYTVGKKIEEIICEIGYDIAAHIYELSLVDADYPEWLQIAVRCVPFITNLKKALYTKRYMNVIGYLKHCYLEQECEDNPLLNDLYGIVMDPKIASIAKTCPKLTRTQLNVIGDILGDKTTFSGNVILIDTYRRVFKYLFESCLSDNVTVEELFDYLTSLVGHRLITAVLADISILPESELECIDSDTLSSIGYCIKDILENMPTKIEVIFGYVDTKLRTIDDSTWVDLIEINDYNNLKDYPKIKEMMDSLYNRYMQYRTIYLNKE